MPSTSIDEVQSSVLGLKRQFMQQVPVGSNNWYDIQLQLVQPQNNSDFSLRNKGLPGW
jgi:hypothetical protein